MENYVVKKSIDLKVPPEDVWDALTNPEKTKKYFFNCRVYSRWRRGSNITFMGKIFFFIPIEMKGEILEVKPQKYLKYKLDNAGSPSSSTVTDELSYENGITTLSITDDVGQGEGAEERYNRSVKGWDKILKGLKEFLEDSKN